MHIFTALACALSASTSVVSAARIHGRNAQRMAQGLPPLPPRMTTRTDTARRNLPSGVPTSLLVDGDFETESDSPWYFGINAIRSDDSTLCQSGSHCALIQPGIVPMPYGYFQYPITLTPGTDYTVTFSDYFKDDPAYDVVSCNPSLSTGDITVWQPSPYTASSTTYSQQTATFTAPSSDDNPSLYFTINCRYPGHPIWLVDDVTLTEALPVDAPGRK
ncbi:hypothetical protein DL96DRAFT_894457 [Flagelloscypha sp. PMI_526]|nr:hypothetical protein DL96DRAFT_894457 [Flagelloscypha sp. PMI_526]